VCGVCQLKYIVAESVSSVGPLPIRLLLASVAACVRVKIIVRVRVRVRVRVEVRDRVQDRVRVRVRGQVRVRVRVRVQVRVRVRVYYGSAPDKGSCWPQCQSVLGSNTIKVCDRMHGWCVGR
jgi:hypothetical protein